MRRRCLISALLVLALAGLPAGPAVAETIPGANELGPIGSVAGQVLDVLAPAQAAFSLAGAQKPQLPVKIALISTGVDPVAFPEVVRSRISHLGSTGDPIGYGTLAASIILEAAPGAQITSIGIYPGGRFDPAWQAAALAWVAGNAANFHSVLYEVPPREFLDPISASMANGEWEAMSDAIAGAPLEASGGRPVQALALSGGLRAQQTAGRPFHHRAALERFAYLNNRWLEARRQLGRIAAAGVPVVAPAGDDGPRPQTIEGIASLPEVTTVAGHNGRTISPVSSAGPAIDGTIKPDLAAPTGFAALLPSQSALARALGAKGQLDSSLELEWPFGDPPSRARVRLDSTMSAAAVVAGSMATMSAEGLRDPAKQEAALSAASVPIPGVPVWRQGAGLLKMLPTAAFAGSRPLALSHANLGPEPESGEWSAEVPFSGGMPAGAQASTPDFLGVGPDGRNDIRTAGEQSAPAVSAAVSEKGVTLSLPAGDSSYRGGLYCGYSQVSIPLTGGEVEAQAELNGIPPGTEQVPHCLVKGTRLTAKSLYIHDTDAENLTFGLLPALPPGASVLEHPLMLLPVDPLGIKLFFKVTKFHQDAKFGPGTYAYFPNVPPGYYKVRQWSDYGAPITETRLDSSGKPVKVERDIGEKAGYQSFPALILGAVCSDEAGTPEIYGEHGAGSPCTRRWLQSRLGEINAAAGTSYGMEFEKSTGGYLIDPAASTPAAGRVQLRVVFDFLKKMPGAGVASRYIDLIDCDDLNFGTLDVSRTLSGSSLKAALGSEPIDACRREQSSTLPPNPLVAGSAPPAQPAVGKLVLSSGLAWYPFNLTTPNYKAHMSLNFSYSLTNAFIVPVVIVGNDVNWGVVSPQGRFTLPAGTPRTPLNVSSLPQPGGRAEGKANFEFKMLPRGASRGLLAFVVVPADNTPVSAASINDISFELDTWNNTLWPATSFGSLCSSACGHSFEVASNLNRDAVKPASGSSPARHQIQRGEEKGAPNCRTYETEPGNPRVCEDWTVLVHSPGDDAATFDVVNSAGRSLLQQMKDAGAKYFDPIRGVHDFSSRLVVPALSLAGLEASLSLPMEFKTDGRHWEQLTLPTAVNASNPGPVEFRIVDNQPGRQSSLFEHVRRSPDGSVSGAVELPGYHPFRSSAQFLHLP